MRRHVDVETPPEADAQALELHNVLKVLLPIRKQRLSRSERLQRQQQQQLQVCHQQHHDGEQLLQGQSQRYQETVAAFVPQHQGKIEPLNELRDALQTEQQQRDDVLRQRQQIVVLENATQAQQQRVDEALQVVQRCQRDVEKIEYLLQNNEAAPQ
ncbi:hypothetical protein PMPD1_1380 [Paramixta manurensis]|uniref:Type III secretion protein n=1 Tax=Paramixta manurensis TaxID=2740817 RepID=A0A6M8U9I4_9GAMM|nr:hypothetical protein PMPD1_1380 [Erwiniaceae bacterium PD-1]